MSKENPPYLLSISKNKCSQNYTAEVLIGNDRIEFSITAKKTASGILVTKGEDHLYEFFHDDTSCYVNVLKAVHALHGGQILKLPINLQEDFDS